MACVLAVSYILHDDSSSIPVSTGSVSEAGPTFAFVSRVPWHGQPGDWEATARVAEEAGAPVVLGEWASELEHRQAARSYLLEHGFTHALIPDGDEIVELSLLKTLCTIAEQGLAERVYVHLDTYWKSAQYVIRPRERLTPLLLYDLRQAWPVHVREHAGGRALVLSAGILGWPAQLAA